MQHINNQTSKYGSLSRFLGSYFIIYFSLLFVAITIGHFSYYIIAKREFSYEDLFYPLIYALVVSSVAILHLSYLLKELFILLNDDEVKSPNQFYDAKETIPCEIFDMDKLIAQLQNAGLLITSVHREKNIIKIRQRLNIHSLGCGGILHWNENLKQLEFISFSINYYSKKPLAKFNKQVLELINSLENK
ncbi:hypothetical protein EMN47_17640 [Prolixibacteraceae bacterium JC049]|nr:hypothetical protein [Prolixibacteraceae bacterium JC049]